MEFDLPLLIIASQKTETPSDKPLTVAQMVASNHRAANVFRKYGLDFCCGGKKTLDDACSDLGLDVNEVRGDLNKLPASGDLPSQDYRRWSVDFLVEFIVQTHHRYLRAELPVLLELVAKVSHSHGNRFPEMREVFEVFAALKAELELHIEKEERALFPLIIRLERALRTGEAFLAPPGGVFEQPVSAMEEEHEVVGDLLRRLRTLTNNYQPPAGACNTYRVTFAKLRDLEDDLLQHIFLENAVLFPKALELEADARVMS